MEHSVEVIAGSVYEAAALGLKVFRESSFCEQRPGIGSRLTVTLKAMEARHEIRVAQLESWMNAAAKSPREKVIKEKLRALLQ